MHDLVARGEVVALGAQDEGEGAGRPFCRASILPGVHSAGRPFCRAFAQPDERLRLLIAQLLEAGTGLRHYAGYVVRDLGRTRVKATESAFAATPCQVLAAEQDDMIQTRSMATRFAGIGLPVTTFAYAGHYFLAEDAPAVASEILAFEDATAAFACVHTAIAPISLPEPAATQSREIR
jgi:hypothetical protein